MSPLRACSFLSLVIAASAHSSLIYPKPRNAIDSLLPEWSGGKAPYRWEVVNDPPWADYPCACKNGTHACESAQTCLWFSVGCTIGCETCDGGSKGGSNPNKMDRCGSGKKATNNDPAFRTINRHAEAFSEDDWTRFNPWRAPGSARAPLLLSWLLCIFPVPAAHLTLHVPRTLQPFLTHVAVPVAPLARPLATASLRTPRSRNLVTWGARSCPKCSQGQSGP